MNSGLFFPDKTEVPDWFFDTIIPSPEDFPNKYRITDFGVKDDGRVYTGQLQQVIDYAYENGGGLVVVPKGTYISGAVFFKQGVNLYIEEGGMLKGSDDISDYRVCETRIEGQTCKYFSALINICDIDGFTMFGKGTIDGNGLRSWKAFWLRREWNPACTNKDEQRARLIFINNCKNVLVHGLTLQNAQFWTNHIYKSSFVKYVDCNIYSPRVPVAAPSTDAIDIDASTDVLVKGCNISVNDDAVCIKGGKGPWADNMPENGATERVLIENCSFGFSHSCFTCGSECIHCKNVIMRNCKAEGAINFLRLKMRPDTPQIYENISVENMDVCVGSFVNINPWTQFYDLGDRQEIPLSYGRNITMKKCRVKCLNFFDVKACEDQYRLSDFTFEDIEAVAKADGLTPDKVSGLLVQRVSVSVEKNSSLLNELERIREGIL